MDPFLVLYATRDGHTRRIAEHVAARLLARGLAVEVCDVGHFEGSVDLELYSAAIVAASVHAGSHEREMVRFVEAHRADLEHMPSAFLSVSLSEAGAEDPAATPARRAKASEDVRGVVEAFLGDTGWSPARVQPVAGALLYTRYNWLVRFVMKRIARSAGASTDTSRDHVFTDWAALDRFVDDFVENVAAPRVEARTASAV